MSAPSSPAPRTAAIPDLYAVPPPLALGVEPSQAPQTPHTPPPRRRVRVRLLGALLSPVTFPLRMARRALRGSDGGATLRRLDLPPDTPMRRSSSVRSMEQPRSREREALPARRDVLGEKVTPAARLALEAAGLEDGGAAPPARRAPRPSLAAAMSARESSALEAIAAALRANGAGALADNRRLLARFAATRGFEVASTTELLVQYVAWRKAMRLDKLTRSSIDVAAELEKRYIMWLPAACDNGTAPSCSPEARAGRDVDGKPVLYKCMAAWERAPRGETRGALCDSATHALELTPPPCALQPWTTCTPGFLTACAATWTPTTAQRHPRRSLCSWT